MKNRHLLLPVLVFAFLALFATPALAATGHGLTGSFGSAKSTPVDPEPLSSPAGVAVNEVSSGNIGDVYVVDKGANRVEYFSASGEYKGQFSGKGTPGELSGPEAIAIDNDAGSPSKGDVYVTDNDVVNGPSTSGVVDKFSASGTYLGQIAAGAGGAPFEALYGVGVDASGKVWVYQHTGEIDNYSDEESNKFIESRSSQAEGGGFLAPGFAVNSDDELYVDYTGSRIVAKLNDEGAVLEPELGGSGNWGGVTGITTDLMHDDAYIVGEPTEGKSGVGEFAIDGSLIETFGSELFSKHSSQGIGIDAASGTVYVADGATNDVLSFTVGAKPEMPVTEAPQTITATSAEFVGTLKSPGTKLKYYFEYYEGQVAECNGTGTKTTEFEGEGKVSLVVEGLHPSAEYTYCLVAKNTYGSEAGAPETFPTRGANPKIISETASSVGREYLQLAAEINPNNQETTYTFEYSTEKIKVEKEEGTKSSGTLSAGFGAQPAGVEVEEEEPTLTATYYYRVVATNATGTSTGDIQEFTRVPEVVGESASGLTPTEATLEAAIKVNYQATKYRFEYSTIKKIVEEGKATSVSGEQELGARGGDPAQTASVVLSGLSSNTIYYYRIVAENKSTENPSNADAGKPVVGKVEEFTTRSLPFDLSTGAAQGITRTTATLSGTLTSRFVGASYYFEYISEAGYQAALEKGSANPYAEGETTAPLALAAGESPQAVGPILASGLRPGETYHYALVASNYFGKTVGPDQTLTTLAGTPPIVATGGVSGVSQNSATLTGTVGTNSLQTEYGFEIGTEPFQPGTDVPATGLGSIGGAATQEVSTRLGELQPGTTYYYRVTASNADGTERGQPGVFTTPGFPTLVSPPASPPLIAYTAPAFPKEEKAGGTTVKKVTNAEKLKKALKVCKQEKPKAKRLKCEAQAKKKYPTAGKKAKKK